MGFISSKPLKDSLYISSQTGRKFTPTPKFLGTAEAYLSATSAWALRKKKFMTAFTAALDHLACCLFLSQQF